MQLDRRTIQLGTVKSYEYVENDNLIQILTFGLYNIHNNNGM